MAKILFVVGSLRKRSLNRQLAHEIERAIGGRADVAYLDYADLPPMNQDDEFPEPPAAVRRVRDAVAAADALWIVSPEYNGSYPGHVKALIDWLSRPLRPNDYATPLPIRGMPVTISTAAGVVRGQGMVSKLTELLLFVDFAKPVRPFAQIRYGRDALSTDVLTLSEEDEALVKAQVEAFLTALSAHEDARAYEDAGAHEDAGTQKDASAHEDAGVHGDAEG